MESRIIIALEKIKNKGWIKALKECSGIEERYRKLEELLPEIWFWDTISARQLIFRLHWKYQLNLGVCPFYFIDDNDKKEYCFYGGIKLECLCLIPQPFCIFRDEARETFFLANFFHFLKSFKMRD